MAMSPRLLRPRADSRADFPHNPNNLVLVFDTSKEPANLQVSVPLNGTVNCTIDWGDGSSELHTTTGFKTHTYASGGVYIVQISGTMTQLNYNTGSTSNNRAKLVRCLSFGNVGLTSLYRGLRDCSNLIQCSSVLPSTVASLGECLQGCVLFNDARIGSWDTAAVTDMFRMFSGCSAFNQDIGSWNTAAVTRMGQMFYDCDAFSADLSGWDLSALNVTASLDSFMALATGMATADYDATLIGWEADKASYRSDLRPNFGGSKYTAGGAARAALVTYGWTITDGGMA